MTIEEIIKEAFSRGWNASHECATDFDYDCALNGFLSEVETEVKKFRIGAVSSSLSMREIAEQLWSLLDNIDTLSDICKPTVNDPKTAMAFYNNALKYAGKRFELLKSDGYKLYTNEEFEALPKSESSFAFLDKDDYKDEKQHNSERP